MPLARLTFLVLLAAVLCVAPSRTAYAAPEAVPCAPERTDMTISYGDVVTCELEADVDSDLFRFLGTAGERVDAVHERVLGTVYRASSSPTGPSCWRAWARESDGYRARSNGDLHHSHRRDIRRSLTCWSRNASSLRRAIASPSSTGRTGRTTSTRRRFRPVPLRGSVGDVITIDAAGSIEDRASSSWGRTTADRRPAGRVLAAPRRGPDAGRNVRDPHERDLRRTCTSSRCSVSWVRVRPASVVCATERRVRRRNACTIRRLQPCRLAADALGCVCVAIHRSRARTRDTRARPTPAILVSDASTPRSAAATSARPSARESPT